MLLIALVDASDSFGSPTVFLGVGFLGTQIFTPMLSMNLPLMDHEKNPPVSCFQIVAPAGINHQRIYSTKMIQ